MSIIKIILTLLVSGLIGYLTNFIAVKMLFRPMEEKHLFGHKVPFTPGIIPKGKPRLAKALGNAVSDTLLTNEDIVHAVANDDMANKASASICSAFFTGTDSIKDTLVDFTGKDNYDITKAMLESKMTDKIIDCIKEADIGKIVITEGTGAIKEKIAGTMMAMFVTDELIAGMAEPVGDKINEYIDENGNELISDIVKNELCKLESSTLSQSISALKISPDVLNSAITRIYKKFLSDKLPDMLASLDLRSIVEQKVNDMPVMELEELVLSVMKNELNSIINLGALIGLIIGILNVLIGMIK